MLVEFILKKPLFFSIKQCVLCIFCISLSATLWSAEATPQPSQNTDIRILIDVSGSMKKNDPKNLRLPALRLLIGLLPPQTNAAVWTFGTKTIPIVPMSITDEKWKTLARQASNSIHSKDLFTNIGPALEASITGWDQPDSIRIRIRIRIGHRKKQST